MLKKKLSLVWRMYPNVVHEHTLVLGLWKKSKALIHGPSNWDGKWTKGWIRHCHCSSLCNTVPGLPLVPFPVPPWLFLAFKNKLMSSRNSPLSSQRYPTTWIRLGTSHYFLAVVPTQVKMKAPWEILCPSFKVISPVPRRDLENRRHSTYN